MNFPLFVLTFQYEFSAKTTNILEIIFSAKFKFSQILLNKIYLFLLSGENKGL